jgi:hypothetical protein
MNAWAVLDWLKERPEFDHLRVCFIGHWPTGRRGRRFEGQTARPVLLYKTRRR